MNRSAFLMLILFMAVVGRALAVVQEPVAHQETVADQNTCTDQNYYLEALTVGGHLRLLSSPLKEDTKCGTEWRDHGTCCDVQSAVDLVQRQNAALEKELHLIDSEMKTLDDDFKKLMRQCRRTQNAKVVKARLKKRKRFFRKYFQVGHMVAYLAKGFGKKQEICLKKLTQLRANSICPICSARSQVYFEDSRLRMNEQQCRSILVDCGPAWMDTLKMIRLSYYYSKFARFTGWTMKVRITNLFKRKFNKMFGKKWRKRLSRRILKSAKKFDSRNKLQKHLESCRAEGTNFKHCPFSVAETLCRDLVEIIPRSYLIDLEKQQQVHANNTASSLEVNNSRVLDLPSSSSRRLNFAGFGGNANYFQDRSSGEISLLETSFGVCVAPDSDCRIFELTSSTHRCVSLSIQFP